MSTRVRNSSVIASSRAIATTTAAVRRARRVVSDSRAGTTVRALGAGVRRTWSASHTERGAVSGSKRLRSLLTGAALYATISRRTDRLGQSIRTAQDRAAILSIGTWVTRQTHQSFLYRWLTAEPDPDVIVIDLRETWTAGPVIEGLDRTIAELLPGVRSARITQTARGVGRTMARRPLAYLGGALVAVAGSSLLLVLLFGTPSTAVIGLHLGVLFVGGVGMRSARSLVELRNSRIGQWIRSAFEPPSAIAEGETTNAPNDRDR